jgi:5-hydroxyisourate hydrolase
MPRPPYRRSLLLGGLALTAMSPRARAAEPGLTTHVLDTTTGRPAEGVRIDFAAANGETFRFIRTVTTNADGRNGSPLLTAETIKIGQYQLTFYIADYFRKRGTVLPTPAFLEKAIIQFGIADAGSHYHVPLLASPWSYTTYRGS